MPVPGSKTLRPWTEFRDGLGARSSPPFQLINLGTRSWCDRGKCVLTAGLRKTLEEAHADDQCQSLRMSECQSVRESKGDRGRRLFFPTIHLIQFPAHTYYVLFSVPYSFLCFHPAWVADGARPAIQYIHTYQFPLRLCCSLAGGRSRVETPLSNFSAGRSLASSFFGFALRHRPSPLRFGLIIR